MVIICNRRRHAVVCWHRINGNYSGPIPQRNGFALPVLLTELCVQMRNDGAPDIDSVRNTIL